MTDRCYFNSTLNFVTVNGYEYLRKSRIIPMGLLLNEDHEILRTAIIGHAA